MKKSTTFLALMLFAVPTLQAQIVADGTTNTLSNVTTNITGDVTVGTNGSFTLLVLSDNVLLTNSVNGLIGRNATAKSNEVQLLSAAALWRMGGSLFIGSNGSLNRLVVSNGAFVNNNNGILGNGAASSNNFALVTGSGSLWSNRIDLTVGVSGRDNQLIVSNGARVVSRLGNIGQNSGSSNNLVVVTGSGSSWTNHLDVNVGVNERSNRLVIEAGGQAGGDNGRVGAGVFSDGSEALVIGPGSLWSSRTDLAVGLNSGNNRLVVSNGAAVVSGNNGRVGVSGAAGGNQVLVTGAGSLWSNRFELYVGEGNMGNRMEVNSGGRVVSSNTYVGYQGAGNFALVTGASSLLSNRADMYVGHSSSANQLVVTNGALVVNSNGYLGFNVSGSNNFILLTGPGTLWSNRNDFVMGNFGAGNQVVISNGAAMHIGHGGLIGGNSGARSNSVTVTDPGTKLTVADFELYVGSNSPFNQLVISNGAKVNSGLGTLGESLAGSNNLAVVTGAGSLWSNRFELYVGFQGDENRLVVTNGGRVHARGARVGFIGGNSHNQAIVTGSGSLWTNAENFVVGSGGRRAEVVVSDNGTVAAGQNAILGEFVASASNIRLTVDGGTLRATNVLGTGTLDVRSGTNVFKAGLIDVDRLLLTNSQGFFEFNGGTLAVKNSTFGNGQVFRVGNGVSPATLLLAGDGTHAFSSSGLSVAANGVLAGNGTASGAITVQPGGLLSPGASIGRIFAVRIIPPLLQGTVLMEVSKTGSVLTNDVLQVPAAINYGGSLVVSNLGPTALTVGDSFRLFEAGGYTGSFASVTLPMLGEGLVWTNKLLVNGSIEVVGVPPTVQTLAASALNLTNATLNGLANPKGTSTLVWFEWGTSTNYGNVTSAQALGSGTNNANFSEVLTGLVAGVTYHFRAVGSNAIGLVFGKDLTLPNLTFQAYLKASNTGSNDLFGFGMALSGNTLVIGARFESSAATGVNGDQNNNSAVGAGAVYVFVRNGTNWTQQAYLKASNTDSNDQFGTSVGISGDTIVASARFESSSSTGVNGNEGDNSAPSAGAAYVYVRSGTNWIQQAYLKASNTGAGDNFGQRVGISGDTIVVGAPLEASNATGVNGDGGNNTATDSGAAYVFVRNGTNWTQQAYLKAHNTGAGDVFGQFVAISGDTVLITANQEDSNAIGVNGDGGNNTATNSGAAYVFVRSGTNWSQQAYLKASNTEAEDRFGLAAAVSGDTVVVGADLEDSIATGVNGDQTNNLAPVSGGAAYVFVRSGTNWAQQAYLKASNTDNNPVGTFEQFGFAVAVSGDTVVVGALGEDSDATGVNGDQSNNNANGSGAVYLFVRNGTNWTQQSYLKASNTGVLDSFGNSVAISDEMIVVGARVEDSSATGINGDGSNNDAIDSGAAYVFDRPLIPAPLLSIVQGGVSQVTLSWTPPTPGFVLQEALSLPTGSWSNSSSGETNPITIPVIGPTKFYRLFKP